MQVWMMAWSLCIGLNLMLLFLRGKVELLMQMPHCKVRTFDPTVPALPDKHLQQLKDAGLEKQISFERVWFGDRDIYPEVFEGLGSTKNNSIVSPPKMASTVHPDAVFDDYSFDIDQ